MEQKLKEFKSRRRRETLLSKPKHMFFGALNKISFKKEVSMEPKNLITAENEFNTSQVFHDDEEKSFPSSDVSISLKSRSWLTITIYFLYLVLWMIIYLISIQLEFGYVYLVLSGLAFIYFNTRTGPKKVGEISAYSVFNPGCEAIEGTLKAEQLEREFNLIQH